MDFEGPASIYYFKYKKKDFILIIFTLILIVSKNAITCADFEQKIDFPKG